MNLELDRTLERSFYRSVEEVARQSVAGVRRVYLVDDDDAFRASLRFLLEGEGFAVSDYADPKAFLELPRIERPGCLLLDLRLGNESGLDTFGELRNRQIDIPVILITAVATVPDTVRAFRGGVYDVIQKPLRKDELLAAMRRALDFDEECQTEQLRSKATEIRFERLSAREWEVLELLVTGHRNKEIASILKLAPKTVECHRAKVMAKTEAKSLGELASAYWKTPALRQNRGEP